MDNNSRYFMELLTSFLKETLPPKPCNVDWQRIYNLSSIHFISGAVYLAVERLKKEDKPEQAILNKFKSDFFNTTLRYEQQEKIYQEIIKKLNERRIEHLFFKGSVIRDYYPVKQMRTLGDIDFLLHEKDQRAAYEALSEVGYKNLTTNGHWQYKKGKLLIESHDKIMYSNINSKADYAAYFENVWDNASACDNSYTYQLNMEYHVIFLITHIAKHFYGCGAGVRMILDIAVIINKFGNSLNFSYIWEELKKLKLDVFAQNIFELCDRWFQVAVPNINFNMDDELFESMSKYILEGGTFGFNNRNPVVQIIRCGYEKTNNRKLALFKAFWGKIFLNYKDMKKLYPVIKNLPFLLPFAWIARGLQCIIKKRSRTVNILKGFAKCSDEAEESYNMMKGIGL